jgi:hypothetical protein
MKAFRYQVKKDKKLAKTINNFLRQNEMAKKISKERKIAISC